MCKNNELGGEGMRPIHQNLGSPPFMESTLNIPIFWSLIPMPAEWTANPPGDDSAILSPAERTKLASLRLPKRRTEWLYGRRVAKQLLSARFPQIADSNPAKISVLNTPSGAPYFADEGGNTIPVALSLSHRAGWAACAITDHLGLSIGIDLECIEPRADSFVETFFTEAEIDFAKSLHGKQRDLWVTLVWSMKEAALKALGQGLRLDTRAVQVQPPAGFAPAEAGWQPVDVTCPQSAPSHCSAWFMRRDDLLITLAIREYREKSDWSIIQSTL
jgi:4'-phosphopantetheinyl transferase